jgi:hypothetical protein
MGNSNESNQTLIGAAIIVGVIFVALIANFSDSNSSRSRNQNKAENVLEGNTSKVDEETITEVPVNQDDTTHNDVNNVAPSFVIQVGSFTVQENLEVAEQVLDRLKLIHDREITVVNEVYYWRLLISGRDNDDLTSTLELLRTNGFTDAFVR